MALDPDRIQKPLRRLRKLLKENPSQPTPEEIHDLRTNTRRLEATLNALSLNSGPKERLLLKDLARIRKRAGRVRDMDVLTGFASTVHPAGEQDCSVQLLEHLGAQRHKKVDKLHTVVAKRRKALRHHLKETARDFKKVFSPRRHDRGLTAFAHATASAFKVQSQLTAPGRLGRNNLHSYRLKVKELHNILKMAARAEDQEFIEKLGRVKDAIGEWHDWEELLAVARDLLDHKPACKLLREVRRIGVEKYGCALSEAKNMRRRYLRITSSKTGTHPSQPADVVWKVTKAIAA